MKKRVAITIIVVFTLFCVAYIYEIFTLKPHWVYLYEQKNHKKAVTVFYPKWYPWNGRFYIIPGKYMETSVPSDNYIKMRPKSEDVLYVNWQPHDGRDMKIQFPICGQEYEDHLDTTRYMIYRNCGRVEAYMDKGDSFYFPKYQRFEYGDWIINGKNQVTAP